MSVTIPGLQRTTSCCAAPGKRVEDCARCQTVQCRPPPPIGKGAPAWIGCGRPPKRVAGSPGKANDDQPSWCEQRGAGARALHRPADAALRGPAAGARAGPVHRRPVAAGAGLRGVRARPARPCARPADRHRRGRRGTGRGRGADRRGTMSTTASSACRTSPIRRTPSTSRCRASRRRRSARFSTSRNCRSRSTCVRFVGEAVAVVIAESLPAARDGAEAVAVDVRGAPRRHRRVRGAGARRAGGLAAGARTISRSTMPSAIAPGSTPRWPGPPRGRTDHPLPAHRQRLHGAALGARRLRRGREEIHADVRLPGRASHPASARASA